MVLVLVSPFLISVHAAEPKLTDILNYLGFTNIALRSVETFSSGSYKITLYAEFAGYHAGNELSYYQVGTSTYNVIFTGPEGGYEYVVPPITKSFTINYQFGLSMLCGETGYRYFTQKSRNPDGLTHARVYENLNSPGMYLIGFENFYGQGGDRDFNDMVFSLKPYTNQAPVASFTYSPANPLIYDIVTFNASASYDPDGNIVSYKWDFGDGNVTTVTSSVITHVYTNATSTVNYTVTLTVTDNEGLTGFTTHIVPVTNPSILYVSLPAGTYVGPNPDNWLSQCWLLNSTGLSGTFTVRVEDTSCGVTSYDTHLIIALNNASHQFLSSLTVGNTTIPKSSFTYGTPKPYGFPLTWEGDVYPTWFSDIYVIGTINSNSYKDMTVSVSFSNATGVRMHFDAYGSATYPPPPATSKHVTDNPHQKDSTVLFWPPPPPPLSVSISPTSVTMNLGQHVTFTSTVSGGTPPYSYQWYLNGAPVGTNSGSWTFTPISAGLYTVYLNVTDNVGVKAKSNIASVTVNPTLSVSISPTSATIDLGQSKTFTSTVSGGTPPYTYQWYLNGAPVGTNSGSWTFTPISAGLYTVYLNVTDGTSATAKSNVASVTVNPALAAFISPTNVTIDLGQSVEFHSVVSGGTLPYFYQWYLNGARVSGATNPDWTFTPISTGFYTVYLNVSDSAAIDPFAISNTANVTVNPQLTVSINPPSTTITLGQSVLFNAVVSGGTPPYSYQWDVNGTLLIGETNSTFNFTPTQPGYYNISLFVTDGAGANASAFAAVTVLVPEYYLTVKTNPLGLIPAPTPSSGWYNNCTYVDLTAPEYANVSANIRYRFDYWDVDGANVLGNPITVHMDANHTATAHYVLQYYLSMSTNFGTVAPGNGWHNAGSTVQISASAPGVINGEQYVWLGWTGTGTGSYSGIFNPANITMNSPITETASWRHEYRLTMNTNFGSTNPSVGEHWYQAGSTVQISATAPSVVTGERYVWLEWTGTGTISYSGSINQTTITMNSPITQTAAWRHEYYLTVTSPYDSPSPTSAWFEAGTPITASVTSPWPNGATSTRYVCTGWTGTGSVPPSGTGTSVPFTINAPSSITWSWKTQYYLTVSSAHGATGGSGWYNVSGTAYATVAPLTVPGLSGIQYVFTQWSGDASGNTSPSNPITMDGPKTAVANWKIQYYLTVNTDPTGSSPTPTPPSDWYNEGTNVQLTAPDTTYKGSVKYLFKDWKVDGVSQGDGVKQITVSMGNLHTATAYYETEAPPAVGGYAAPISIGKEASHLSASHIGLAFSLLAAMAATILVVRRKSKMLK